MLQSRNLDDQTFDDIMELVMGKLPWLCPAWTDYNEHDPGITVLELMAWYKEMQQYHLNTVTDALRKKLLKLLGVMCAGARPARLMLTLPEGTEEIYPALTRLEGAQDIPFELTESAARTSTVDKIFIAGKSGVYDATDALSHRGIAVWCFGDGKGEDTELYIRLSGNTDAVKLYFEIDSARRVARNPFKDAKETPRTLEWSAPGAGKTVVTDETHALSESGFVSLSFEGGIPQSDGGCGLPEGRYIRVRETEHGCEERVRLKAIDAARFEAVQRETIAKLSSYTVGRGKCTIALTDALSIEGTVLAFIREGEGEGEGLTPVETRLVIDETGASICFDASGCACDGKVNAYVISLDPVRGNEFIFASTGLPGMTVELPIMGRRVITDGMMLVCDTRYEDGSVRPALWHYVEDISVCGARDRVFGFDAVREQLVFGDGEHGMIVPKGEHAIVAAGLALSYCAMGNLPEGSELVLPDGVAVRGTAAFGGAEAQSALEAAREFLHGFKDTRKCASAEDYEAAAKATPGLRVAAAKAISMFDPDEPGGNTRIPTVTVVVMPDSETERPMPDARFLAAVQAQLDAARPVCTVVKAIAPEYVPVGVTVQMHAQRGAENAVREAIEGYFDVSCTRNIGENVVRDDIAEVITRLEGVTKLDRLELRSLGQSCYAGTRGDLVVNCSAVAYPAEIRVLIK